MVIIETACVYLCVCTDIGTLWKSFMEWWLQFKSEPPISRTGVTKWSAFWTVACPKSQVSQLLVYPSWTLVFSAFSSLVGIEVLRGLAEEGVEKSYTEHYLQDELESAIQEVDKLNTAANQIIASKHRAKWVFLIF